MRLKPWASRPSSSSVRGVTRAESSPRCTRAIACVISCTGRESERLSIRAAMTHSIRLSAPMAAPMSSAMRVMSRVKARGWLSSSVKPLTGSSAALQMIDASPSESASPASSRSRSTASRSCEPVVCVSKISRHCGLSSITPEDGSCAPERSARRPSPSSRAST